MNKDLFNLVSVILFLVGLFWVVYSIFSTFGTKCFDMVKAYLTIIILLLNVVWNNFIVKLKEE